MTNAITIRESETEYFLYVPFPQKDRAKTIAGYRWDTEKKCWVYPRTGRIYDSLISEFGDDLVEPSISRPVLPIQSPAQEQSHRLEDERFRDELVRIRGELEQMAKSSGNDAAVRSMQEILASRDREIELLRNRLNDRETALARITQTANETQAEVNRLRTHLSSVTNQATTTTAEKLIKEMAIQSTGGDKRFASFLSRVSLDEHMLIDLAKQLEEELRRLVNAPERRHSLNDLIYEARDANLLPDDAISLAHMIRKQRNIVAHGDEYKVTYKARVLLSLFAASLLWPEFPE